MYGTAISSMSNICTLTGSFATSFTVIFEYGWNLVPSQREVASFQSTPPAASAIHKYSPWNEPVSSYHKGPPCAGYAPLAIKVNQQASRHERFIAISAGQQLL